MITPYNILRHELIGLKARLAFPQGGGNGGFEGKVVGESKNTVTFETIKGRKTIPKEGSIFQFTLDEGAVVEVDGGLLCGRPVDRIKKKVRIEYI